VQGHAPNNIQEELMAGKQSRGTCLHCGYETTKGSMGRHLTSCKALQSAIGSATQSSRKPEQLYRLRAKDAYGGQFWIDLELRGSAKLSDLDSYLRAIWLECCGHMSQFSIGGWRGEEIGMSRKIEALFHEGVTLTHIYDFGTSSETQISYVSEREGVPLTTKPIVLLARNLMPEASCSECGQPATYYCTECQIEEGRSGMLCTPHAESHPHNNYGEPVALVNSPRMGMCGYDGPALPPY
jgi:hypothetical protein